MNCARARVLDRPVKMEGPHGRIQLLIISFVSIQQFDTGNEVWHDAVFGN